MEGYDCDCFVLLPGNDLYLSAVGIAIDTAAVPVNDLVRKNVAGNLHRMFVPNQLGHRCLCLQQRAVCWSAYGHIT